MKLYYAHYPALEDSFAKFVVQERRQPLEKWLVICSSSFLAQRLQTRLATQTGAVANIHFIAGSVFLKQLDKEQPQNNLPLVPQNHIRDFLIKEILTEPGFNRYPVSQGLIQAIKGALRDLADSLADPNVLEEHWHSMPDAVLEQDAGRFEWLIGLYKRYQEKEKSLTGYRTYQDMFEHALAQVENSGYLHSFSHIVLYGFYDMTGRQLDLFNRLQDCYPVSVFAPYQKHPAYDFAKKFFETNWLKHPHTQDENKPFTGALKESAQYLFSPQGSAPAKQVSIVNVPNVKGAVFYTAKEIAKLITQGHSTADIAVIARTLPPYQDEIRRIFKENFLPLQATFSYPFLHYTLGTLCLNLLNLAEKGFCREDVLSIFSSPYFNRPERQAWQRLVSKSLVKRDLAQWQDLLPKQAPATPEVLAWLNQTVKQLQSLAHPQLWEKGAQKILDFLAEQIDVNALQGKDREIYQAIQDTITSLAKYQLLRSHSREGELLREATAALTALCFNEVETMEKGITVTDAIRARGLRFKTVFVLGVNDKEFPLLYTEDPLLRDYYRYQLRDTLGYWINPSLDRAVEEKLLFYNAVTAAQDTLHVLYARYGADEKPAVPSIYVTELARACEIKLEAPSAPYVSGQFSKQLAAYPLELWTKQEVSLYGALLSHPQPYYQQAGLLTPDNQRSLAAAQALCSTGPLGSYDGIIPSQTKALFEQEHKRGFSPSALQKMASCPLRYFFHYGLRLEEPGEPANRETLAANEQGTLYHTVLHDFYQTLRAKKLTHSLFDTGAQAYLEGSINKHYSPLAYRTFGIYPVIWDMILEKLRQTLADFVKQDLNQLGLFSPALFEWEITGEPTAQLPLRLRGIIDRVDLDNDNKLFKIIDYKSTRKGSASLTKDFFALSVFQPFLYILLAKQQNELKGYQTTGSCLLSIVPYSKRDLTPAEFDAMQQQACHFLTQLADWIKEGTFFITPSKNCKYCPYSPLCRKDSFKPLLRAQKSTQLASLEEARQ